MEGVGSSLGEEPEQLVVGLERRRVVDEARDVANEAEATIFGATDVFSLYSSEFGTRSYQRISSAWSSLLRTPRRCNRSTLVVVQVSQA